MKRLRTHHGDIFAEQIVDGIPVNPKLPEAFDSTPNDERPDSHRKFWGQPYIQTYTVDFWDRYYANRTDQWAEEGRRHWAEGRQRWMEAWPTGTRYDVRCLDGGAWDRSSAWGAFASLAAAIACAKGA